MNKMPTSLQWLVSNISAKYLDIAYQSGDARKIFKAERFYKDLKEDECIFSDLYHLPDGRYSRSITCYGRGFMWNSMKNNVGELLPMVRDNATYISYLRDISAPISAGFFYVNETGELYITYNDKYTTQELLDMTGYRFEPDEYILNPGRYIDVKNTVVRGRIHLIKIVEEVKDDHVPPAVPGEVVTEGDGEVKLDKGENTEPESKPEAPAQQPKKKK